MLLLLLLLLLLIQANSNNETRAGRCGEVLGTRHFIGAAKTRTQQHLLLYFF